MILLPQSGNNISPLYAPLGLVRHQSWSVPQLREQALSSVIIKTLPSNLIFNMSDTLNPACRTAGIRWIPVVNGKYKVWTKKIGSGKTKVLLLHGGPGFNHEYFECMVCVPRGVNSPPLAA